MVRPTLQAAVSEVSLAFDEHDYEDVHDVPTPSPADSAAPSAFERLTLSTDLTVHVFVMSTYAARDILFGEDGWFGARAKRDDPDQLESRRKRAVFVWTGADEPPVQAAGATAPVPASAFNRYQAWRGDGPAPTDEVGKFMLAYLIIIAAAEGSDLAQSIFSSLSAKVVEVLHQQ